MAVIRFALVALLLIAPTVPAATASSPVRISITSTLSHPEITIEPGTSVTFVNDHDERHRIRSVDGPEEFDSGNLEPGESFALVFQVAGTYTYVDDRDAENVAYHGSVTVSDQPPAPPPPSGGTNSTVDIVDRSYRPPSISVSVGSSVKWVNIDDRAHTVTSNSGQFDSGVFAAGGQYTRTFDEVGTFNYFCTLHPDMVGSVTVSEAGSGPPPPPPPPPQPPAPPPTSPPPPTPVTPGEVSIFDNGFTPQTLTVTKGTSVTWANTGNLPHTVTDRADRFDSGLLFSGSEFSRVFDVSGIFNYFCTIHPEMTGSILVTDSQGGAPPPPPPVPDAPSPGVAPAPSSGSGRSTVEIVDNAYQPASITVPVGSTLTFSNVGSLPHTVTDRGGSFDSGIVGAGERFRETFSDPGTYNYFCTIHPEMTGTVRVTAGGTPLGTDEASTDGAPLPETSVGTIPIIPGLGRTGTTSDAGLTIDVVDLDYEPDPASLEVGTEVRWVNIGDLPHTVTLDGLFDSGLMAPGDEFSFRFTEEGTFTYFCTLHPGMEGIVEVVASLGTADLALPVADSEQTPPTAVDSDQSMASRLVVTAGAVGLGLWLLYSLGYTLRLSSRHSVN